VTELRTSSYTIYVDLPDNGSEMLLVHTYTGAYDKVSRQVAAYVRSLEIGKAPKPLYGEWEDAAALNGHEVAAPSEATLGLLQKRGYLTPMNREQERRFFTMFVEKLHENQLRRFPSYLFMPTYDCNLRCSYCFQDHMRTKKEFRHLLRTMKPEMVDRIFAAMPAIEALHEVPEDHEPVLDIGFFGGEPLLEASRPIVEYIMRRAGERGKTDFWAISNGTELDAYEDLLAPDKLARVQITLDGPPGKHDARRIYADGSGSWERIAPNVTMALDRGVVVAIRTNADRTNVGDLPALAAAIIEQGWDRYPNFVSQVAPIRAGNDKTEAKTTFSTWQLDQKLAEMRQEHSEMRVLGSVDDSIRNQARRIFGGTGQPSLKPSFCAAHTGMYIFDAFGDVYACWEKTGDAKIRIAHVKEGGEVEFRGDMQNLWRGRHVATNPVCLQCRYNLYCGGGCAVLALGAQGDYYRNYCDGYSKRFRHAVAEAFQAHQRGDAQSVQPEAFCDM
jgi:uncharacterized protein